MLKKLFFPLLIVVFLAWFFIGFLSAGLFTPEVPLPSSASSAAAALSYHQNTFLMIRTNDLQSPNPQVYGVWAVFFYPMDPPLLMFLPLFPSQNPSIDASILSTFSLDETGQPQTNFLNTISENYDFLWDGYLLLDDFAASSINSNLTAYGELAGSPIPPIADPNAYFISSEIWLEIFCTSLPLQGSQAFSWQDLVPDHFRSNLNFETALIIWSQMTEPDQIINCEILTPN